MYAITTRNLTHRFGNITAVENLNLKVKPGSLFGIIGPNGAGKTTILRMLAGLLEPTSGEIRINELATHQYWREIQWQIGFMPDLFGVYEDLMVWEYLDFFARCYKLSPSRRQRVVHELLELVNLTDNYFAYIHTLSHGLRQRLCLAHALVHDPQILLLDEPASRLDPLARIEMHALLRELQKMGKTILLSSHILTELAELCDSIAILEQGQLIISGSLEEIRRRVGDHRRLRIRILPDSDQIFTILGEQLNIKHICRIDKNGDSGELEIEFSGDDMTVAKLLELLVAQNVHICSFSQVEISLEEAFIMLTQGLVS